ncbi:hypothetical protein J3R82DRAFT_4069 [Butyriboletus roseoflavus]|nr:hypothetical protein J3R82DRAFT_4069 [Butyriboletus roseoflavus]
MGKHNTTKKGKQKDSTPAATASAPPPPPPSPPSPPLHPHPPAVSSPPAAHHIQYPSATIDTIEEQEEFGGLLGGPVEDTDDSWQDVGRSADGWAANAHGNSNGDVSDDGWETGAIEAPMPPSPPPPPPKKFGGGRDHTKPYYPQQRHRLPSSNHQNSAGFGADAGAHNSSWGYAKPQQPQDTWTPANGWTEDGGWGDPDDQANGDDGWGANNGWNDANSGRGQQPHSAAWNHAVSVHPAHSQATPHVPTTGWQSWGEEARRLPKNQQPYPMPANAGASFLPVVANNWQQHQSSQHGNRHQQQQHGRHQSYEHHRHDINKNKKSKPQDQSASPQQQSKSDRRRQEEVHDVWGLGDGWSDLQDEEEQQDMTQDGWGRRVHFSPGASRASMLPSSAPSAPSTVVENFTVNALPQNKLGLSTIPMSKTLSYAYSGSTPSTESEPGRAAMQRITDIQFVESRGEGLKSVQRAFYGKERKAADRFHWLFSPEKDERVSSLLNWINSMSFGIASFGLQKFLQTRERGALIVNAAYRPVHSPSEPTFDWVTWNQIQLTMDRILQESVGYYNPAMHIIVFVVLPSPSGNSVAIWRRKLSIPSNIRLAYQAQITQAMASLRKEYPVFVDELPVPPKPTPPPPPKKKRKWYKLWLSS